MSWHLVLIRRVKTDEVVGKACGKTPAIAEANGRLIAASPDLLDAAKVILQALRHHFSFGAGLTDETRNAIKILGAAIEKAEGNNDHAASRK